MGVSEACLYPMRATAFDTMTAGTRTWPGQPHLGRLQGGVCRSVGGLGFLRVMNVEGGHAAKTGVTGSPHHYNRTLNSLKGVLPVSFSIGKWRSLRVMR
jgi:hypothetical protein